MIQIQLPMSMTATAKLEAASTSNHKAKKMPPQTPQLSDVVMAKSEALLMASSKISNSNSRTTSNRYWWIYGRAYDLTDFVERHPGGVEAILLGRGRDCTALVESYHAFAAPQVWKVLDKYRASDDANENAKRQYPSKERPTDQAEHSGGLKPDIFYDTLKERVTATLQSKGIDPIQNRGASIGRIAYYCLIFALWICTGYMHLSVRRR
jgi:cytochrome b involved in lipid metabolism